LFCFLWIPAAFCAEEPTTHLPQLNPESRQLLAKFFEYDSTIPLESRTVEVKTVDGVAREKIVIRSTQGFLAPGYLQLPAIGSGPYPCVLLLHGWSGSKESWYQDNNYISGGNTRKRLLENGYAVLMLDAQCHGDRIASNDFAPVNHHIDETVPVGQRRKGYFTQCEIYLQTVVDYRRAIDYLSTREEINADRIGVIGYSMGGAQAFMLTAVESRIKATVACATPSENQPFTLYAPQNYAPDLGDRPFFMVSGKNDPMCSIAHAKELYSLISARMKDLRFYEGGHRLKPDFVPHAVEWITMHVGQKP